MEEREYGIKKAEYKRGLNKTLLLFEKEGTYKEDYQLRMLEENQIKGLLKMRGRGIDGSSLYEYDVSGKSSLSAVYKSKKINRQEMMDFLYRISEIITEIGGYLLDTDCLILDPDYIFTEDGAYEFCYYPAGGWDVWKAFHRLVEFFVERTDYQDDGSVRTAFLLHKETMKENYSLKKIIRKLEQEEEETKTDIYEAEEGIKGTRPYDTEEHDWIAAQEQGSNILRETDNMWRPVKKFLRRHKKSVWGEWDGIYIDEEEL